MPQLEFTYAYTVDNHYANEWNGGEKNNYDGLADKIWSKQNCFCCGNRDFHPFSGSPLFERALAAAYDDLHNPVSVGIKRLLSPHLIHYVMFLLFLYGLIF